MNKFLNRYKHTVSLALICMLSVAVIAIGAPVAIGIGIVGCWQLSQFATSKRCGVCFTSALTPEQVKEFEGILKDLSPLKDYLPELKGLKDANGFSFLKGLPELFKKEQERNDDLTAKLTKLTKRLASGEDDQIRMVGGRPYVTRACAEHLGSMFVLKALADGKLASGENNPLVAKACGFLGVEMKAAISATDIPLPVAYANQILELVYVYGTARNNATVFPLSGNSMKLPRLKTGEPQFAFIAVSGSVTEKVPQSEWITFTPGKAGGIVRIPSEISEDSIFDVGQFVARYIAREMAYWEDYCLFLGDGSGTYNSINGIGAQATADSCKLQLSATNSSSDKITLANVRNIRTLATGAIIKTGKYYAHPTFEALFVSFNTSATVTPYIRNADGTATLDGFPIVWTPIMPAYSTSAALNAYQIYFGDLSYWYLGLRRDLDIQTSRDVYFATDEVGIRALERFDIRLMGQKASSALQLSAS